MLGFARRDEKRGVHRVWAFYKQVRKACAIVESENKQEQSRIDDGFNQRNLAENKKQRLRTRLRLQIFQIQQNQNQNRLWVKTYSLPWIASATLRKCQRQFLKASYQPKNSQNRLTKYDRTCQQPYDSHPRKRWNE